MINSLGATMNLRGEALLTACHIINKIPYKKTNKTSYELWKGRVPRYHYFKVWGCLAHVAVPIPNKTKLAPRTLECAFIGYTHNSKAYKFLILRSSTSGIDIDTIIVTRCDIL